MSFWKPIVKRKYHLLHVAMQSEGQIQALQANSCCGISHRDTSCTPHEPHCHANDGLQVVHKATIFREMSKRLQGNAVCPSGIGGHARRMPDGHRRSAIAYGRQTIAMDRLKSMSRRIRNRRSCRRCEAACPWIAPRRRRLSRDAPYRSANSLQRR